MWALVPVLLFLPLRLPAWLVLGLWFALQWAYSTGYAVSEAGSVAYLAHALGGTARCFSTATATCPRASRPKGSR